MRRAILVRMSERSPADILPQAGPRRCGVERQFDVLGGAARDLAERLAVDRRHVLEVLALHRGDPLAADPVVVSSLVTDDAALGTGRCVNGHCPSPGPDPAPCRDWDRT